MAIAEALGLGRVHSSRPFSSIEKITIGGRYSEKKLGGVCGPLPKTLVNPILDQNLVILPILFMT